MKQTRKKCFDSPTALMAWQQNNCIGCKKAVFFNPKRNATPAYRCAIQRDVEMQAAGAAQVSERTYEMTQSEVCPMFRSKKEMTAPMENRNVKGKEIKKETPAFYQPVRREHTSLPSVNYISPEERERVALRRENLRKENPSIAEVEKKVQLFAMSHGATTMSQNSLLMKSLTVMHRKQEQQRLDAYAEADSEAGRIVMNMTYMVICRNELANYFVRKAVQSAFDEPSICRQAFKKHVKDVQKEVSRYDTELAVSIRKQNETILDYADGLTDFYVKKTQRLVEVIYSSILNALLPYDLQYPDMISKFQTASILVQYCCGRLDVEYDQWKQRSIAVSNLLYLRPTRLQHLVDVVLDDINKLLFPKGDDLNLNKDKRIFQAVNNLFNMIGRAEYVRDVMFEYDKSVCLEDFA